MFGPTYSIPPQYMGKNGFIEWNRVINNNNSAGAKIYNVYFGGSWRRGRRRQRTQRPPRRALLKTGEGKRSNFN